MTIFAARDTLTAARLGLAVKTAPVCGCCGYAQDPGDMGPDHEHYGAICVHCDEGLMACTCCGKRRTEADMFRLGDNPVCSNTCDLNLEFDDTNADNRLTLKDVM